MHYFLLGFDIVIGFVFTLTSLAVSITLHFNLSSSCKTVNRPNRIFKPNTHKTLNGFFNSLTLNEMKRVPFGSSASVSALQIFRRAHSTLG